MGNICTGCLNIFNTERMVQDEANNRKKSSYAQLDLDIIEHDKLQINKYKKFIKVKKLRSDYMFHYVLPHCEFSEINKFLRTESEQWDKFNRYKQQLKTILDHHYSTLTFTFNCVSDSHRFFKEGAYHMRYNECKKVTNEYAIAYFNEINTRRSYDILLRIELSDIPCIDYLDRLGLQEPKTNSGVQIEFKNGAIKHKNEEIAKFTKLKQGDQLELTQRGDEQGFRLNDTHHFKIKLSNLEYHTPFIQVKAAGWKFLLR